MPTLQTGHTPIFLTAGRDFSLDLISVESKGYTPF